MSSTRTWTVGTAAVSILLVVAAWFLLISPKRGEAADLRAQRVAQVNSNQQVTLQIAELKAQFASLPAKQAELAVIQRQMPSNPALPTLIRSLSSLSTQAGVTLVSIAPGQASAFVPTATAATGTGTTASGSTATGTSASSAAAASTGTANVLQIPVTLVVNGSYAEDELFLQKLQTSMTRAMLVQTLGLAASAPTSSDAGSTSTGSASPDGSNLQLTITGNIYVLQPPAAATSSTTATGAASTSTPAKTGSAS